MPNVVRRSEHSLLVLVALISLFCISPWRASGQSPQQTVDNQSVLKIESPIEVSGELTLLRDELAQEAQNLDALAKWEGKQIFISTGDLPNAAKNFVVAASGAVFANSKDVQNINNRLGDSAEALGKAFAKLDQAKVDFASGRIARSVAETREGLVFANQSKSEMADAVSQTKAIVERATKVVTVDWDPNLAAQIAGRIWRERPEFAEAARQFAAVGNLMQRQHEILDLEGTYLSRVKELNREIVYQELSGGPRSSTRSATSTALKKGEKMAVEILKMGGLQSGASQLDQATTLKAWLDGGDRSLSPSETKSFYDQYPQLRKYASIAAYRSPESEVQGDLNNGTLKLMPATPSEQSARKINEQKIADETLNNSPLPTTLKETPSGLVYNPDALTPSEKAARQTNEQKMAAETLKSTSLSGDILDPISGMDSFGYSTSTKKSPDGRLTAVTKWSFRNAAGGGFPQSTMKWDVYYQGRFVGEYDDVNLLADGKFQVLTTPGAMGIMTPDGKPRAPLYTTYDAAQEIQKEQFYLTNSASLQNSGYGETEAFGGGVFAGFKLGHGWDLLDSHGRNLGEGVFQQVKPLVGGAFAASKTSFGGDWEVFDASGHRLGNGTYSDVEVQNGRIAAWKQLGGGSPVYLGSALNSSLPVQQSPIAAVSANSVNSRANAQTVSGLPASQGESILQQARQKSQNLQSQQQHLLQQLQNLDRQVREASQRQVLVQQPAHFPSSGTRNPVTPTAMCAASRSASSCGISPSSPQPTHLVPRAVGQQTGASQGTNHTPVGSKPTPPPLAPPPNAPAKAPAVTVKPK